MKATALLAAESVFDPLLHAYRVRADHIMVGMNGFLLIVCIALAPWHSTYAEVLLVGAPTLLLGVYLARRHPGALLTRVFMGCGFMVFTGLIIHQSGGEIESHFSAFGLIGVLLYYRDWRTIVVATVFIYLHHLVLGYAQTLGLPVYVFNDQRFWLKFAVHVAYFLPFIAMMVYLSVWLRREGYESQQVIALAQSIVQGNLVESTPHAQDLAGMPLISAVLQMKSRLVDLLRVLPVAAAVIRTDTDQIVSVNEAWVRVVGPTDDREPGFGSMTIWGNRQVWGSLLERTRGTPQKLLDKMEMVMRKHDGAPFPCQLSLVLHDAVVPEMAILTVEDISQRREAEQTMKRLAYSDLLTELPNRVSINAEMKKALETWQRDGEPFAVVMIDLDGFKPVNDRYGHDTGDEVLKAIAARIQATNRAGDLAGRMGGDEFLVLLRGCPEASIAFEVAQRFISTLMQPIHLRGRETVVKVGASAGVAHVAAGGCNAEIVVKNADVALYQAKAAGKGRVVLFGEV